MKFNQPGLINPIPRVERFEFDNAIAEASRVVFFLKSSPGSVFNQTREGQTTMKEGAQHGWSVLIPQ